MKRFLILLGMLSALAMAGCCTSKTTIPETGETVHNWSLARQYQAAGRYELARQHFSLALSTVRTQSGLDMLQRELAAVDLQIRTMR